MSEDAVQNSPSEFEPSPEGQAALDAVKNPPPDTIANAEATRDELARDPA